MATKQRIAHLTGTFAKPGVSKNRRWYKPEHIAGAVAEAQALIDSGNAPTVFSMMTSHGERDPLNGDVTKTAGQLTKVALNAQGWGTWEADIADTTAGHDIANLTTPESPYLKGVSMASVWKGVPRKVMGPDGQLCETADGFSLKGIDFTHNPGIVGAEISSAELAESAAAGLIYESIEEEIFMERVDEETPAVETAPTFADPGYHGAKALELSTPALIREAWVKSHQKSVTETYTPKQLGRIRGKVKAAAQKAGFDLVAEVNLLGTEILEAYTSVCVDNGPADLRVSAYIDDPSKIAAVTQRVALAALAALQSLDPDNDGDIDLGAGETDDDEMESCASCSSVVPVGALFCSTCGLAIQGESAPVESPTTKEAPVGQETKTTGATETAPITQAQVDEAVAAGVKLALEAAGIKPAAEPIVESDEVIAARKLIAEADAAKPVVETAPVVTPPVTEAAATFTKDEVKEMIAEATKSTMDAARKEIQEAGPRRRGLVPQSILEQSTEDVYGEVPLKDLSLADLERATDSAMTPLLTR
jgi:hypothetical protein